MNIGTNEREHPNSSPLNSPSAQHAATLAETQFKQVWSIVVAIVGVATSPYTWDYQQLV